MKLMDSPSVSGALTYKELVMATKNEERLSELKKRQAYTQTGGMWDRQLPSSGKLVSKQQDHTHQPKFTQGGSGKSSLRCLYYKKLGHFAHDYRQKKADNEGRKGPPAARQVQTEPVDPTTLLQSSESDDGDLVRIIRVNDKGSRPQYAQVAVQGVPATGIVDSGGDITIMGGELFKTVATTCKLKKRDFKPADKVPRTYNQQTFKLDGKMDLELRW